MILSRTITLARYPSSTGSLLPFGKILWNPISRPIHSRALPESHSRPYVTFRYPTAKCHKPVREILSLIVPVVEFCNPVTAAADTSEFSNSPERVP